MKALLKGLLKVCEFVLVLMVLLFSWFFLVIGIVAMVKGYNDGHGILSRWVWGVPRWPALTVYMMCLFNAPCYTLWLGTLVYDLICRKQQNSDQCICQSPHQCSH